MALFCSVYSSVQERT